MRTGTRMQCLRYKIPFAILSYTLLTYLLLVFSIVCQTYTREATGTKHLDQRITFANLRIRRQRAVKTSPNRCPALAENHHYLPGLAVDIVYARFCFARHNLMCSARSLAVHVEGCTVSRMFPHLECVLACVRAVSASSEQACCKAVASFNLLLMDALYSIADKGDTPRQ